MNNTNKQMLKRAVEVAKLSTCGHKHGVVIAMGKRVMSVAVNTHRNDPNICTNPKTESAFHAERNALKQLEGRDLSRAVLYSARVNRSGEPMLAKPCFNCQQAIDNEYGIRSVYFTINEALSGQVSS